MGIRGMPSMAATLHKLPQNGIVGLHHHPSVQEQQDQLARIVQQKRENCAAVVQQVGTERIEYWEQRNLSFYLSTVGLITDHYLNMRPFLGSFFGRLHRKSLSNTLQTYFGSFCRNFFSEKREVCARELFTEGRRSYLWIHRTSVEGLEVLMMMMMYIVNDGLRSFCSFVIK